MARRNEGVAARETLIPPASEGVPSVDWVDRVPESEAYPPSLPTLPAPPSDEIPKHTIPSPPPAAFDFDDVEPGTDRSPEIGDTIAPPASVRRPSSGKQRSAPPVAENA
ncbi:MAG: hypothetical protein IT374_26040 [Polyangiaceae bacterium]|nr:hypothetical protein [Polyangiaceae bacterium]